MIKTRTDLWTIALLSSLGIYSSGCVASSADANQTQAGLRDGGQGESSPMTPTTDPDEGQNTSADAATGDDDPVVNPPSKPSNTATPPDGPDPIDPIDTEPKPPVMPPQMSSGMDPVAPVSSDPVVPLPSEDAGSPPTPTDGGASVQPAIDAGPCGAKDCAPAPGCEGATPLLVGDVDTGLVQCASGVVHRPAPIECPNHLAGHQPPASDSAEGVCTSDAECTAAPNGYCDIPPSMGNALPQAQCLYGCTSDAECGDNQFCLCGEPIGRCVESTCSSAADCEGEFLCAQYFDRFGIGCGEPAAYACQTAADECTTDEDCAGDFGGNCNVVDGSRSCVELPNVACGRPFLVAGEQRLAAVARGSSWSAELARPELLETLTDAQRAKLGQIWTEIGLMEHASVAAFARFTLQLLHLGAPADLVQASVAASGDETRHALACFALASAYTGKSVAPGALSMDAALDAVRLRDVVALAVREGCVGETIAALEAAECAEHCRDAVVRDVLVGIAADEKRHSELAWHFVAWALQQDASLADVVRTECERAAREFAPSEQNDDSFDSNVHGVLTAALRSQIRAAACRDVVLPCMLALLDTARSNAVVAGRHAHELTA